MTGDSWTFFVLSVGAFISFITFLVHQSGKSKKGSQHKPFPPTWPVGILDMTRAAFTSTTNYAAMCSAAGRKGPMHLLRSKWPKLSVLVIHDYELAVELFNTSVFSARPENEWWRYHAKGNYGIVTSSGKVWEEQRRFTLRKLKEAGVGNKSMESFIEREVEDFITALDANKGKIFSPNKMTSVPFFNTLWVLLSGNRFSHGDNESSKMLVGIYEAFMRILEFPQVFLLGFPKRSPITIAFVEKFPKWLPFFNTMAIIGKGFDNLRTFCTDLVKERQKNLSRTDLPHSFIEDYLKEIERTTNEESTFYKEEGVMNLLATMADLFIAGGETASNSLSWSLLHLIRNPDVQLKIQCEIDKVVGRERRPTLSDRPNLPWTEAFVWEMLRLTPASIFSLPHVTTEDVDVGPYFVEKNTSVLLNIPAVHTDPRYWDDPYEFKPQRFLSPDGKQFVKNSKMVAFSIGKRKCPAKQMALDDLFLFVGAICQKFNLKKDPNLKGLPTLSPELSGLYTPKKYFMMVEDRE